MYPKHPELFDENFKEKSMSVFEDIVLWCMQFNEGDVDNEKKR